MDKEIKRLRKKFFILSTSISFVILFVMLLILNLFMQISYHSEFKTADEMIKQTAYSNMPDIDKEIIYLKNFKKVYKIGTIQPKTRPHPPFL